MAFENSNQDAFEQWPKYTGVQLNVAVNTLPKPVLWGCQKLGTNLIEFTDFQSKKLSSGVGKGGGKTQGYDYHATLMLALGERMVDDIPLVVLAVNELRTMASLKWVLLQGTFPEQPVWDYMKASHPEDAFNYPGTAYIGALHIDLGEAAASPNYTLLAQSLSKTTPGDNFFRASWCNPSHIQTATFPPLASAFPSGIPTADMALVIQDFLTNDQYGVECFPADNLDTAWLLSSSAATTTGDGALQTYLRALGIGMSPCLDSTETAQSILGRWAQLCNFAPVWGTNASGMALKCIPYGDETVSGNGVVYLPNLGVVYDLDDDDYLGDSSADPVSATVKDFIDCYNVVRLEVSSDDGFFAGVPVEARDEDAISKAGGTRIMPTVTAHEIVGVDVGAIVSQLLLQQGLYWRNTYQVKLPETFCLLEPMDMVSLTDPILGLNETPCRITQIDEDENGELTVTLQEFVPGVSTAVAYAKQAGGGTAPDTGATASNVNTPIVFEPTQQLIAQANLAAQAQVWMAVCGGGGAFDPNWGGCQVQLSLDNDTYEQIGTINGANRMGVLTANLAAYAGSNPDTTDTLYVDLGESEGELTAGTFAGAQNGSTLCYVDGELISYETCALVPQTATNEAQSVPASPGPYEITLDEAATFIAIASVAYAAGGSLASTGTNPPASAGEYYSDGDGDLVFAAGDAGRSLLVTYTYGNPYHYALTGLYRGQYGTTASAHSSAALFARLDSTIFEYDLPNAYVGVELYIKLVSFNIFGNGLEDISTVSPFTYIPVGTGLPGGIVEGGTYAATATDATNGYMTIATPLASIAVVNTVITRGTSVVTGDAKITTSGSDIKIANGPSAYTVQAGDIVNWLAIGAAQLSVLVDTSGKAILDTSGNTIFAS